MKSEFPRFPGRLRSLLEEHGLSQREFAEKIEVNEVSVSRYVTGMVIPRLKYLTKWQRPLIRASTICSGSMKKTKERKTGMMDDLISRQAAIDMIHSTFAKSLARDMAEKCIRSVSSAQRWIPCSERLPEKPNMYTVTDSKGDVVRFVFDDTESSREYWLRCAKAWMPLPEPYREGGDERWTQVQFWKPRKR